MFRLSISLAAILALSVLTGPSLAGTGTRHKLSETRQIVQLSSTGCPPTPGKTAVFLGAVVGKPGGSGADIDRSTCTGISPGGVISFKSIDTVFYARGSTREKLTGTVTRQPDGSFKFAGTGTIVGGTGAFKGATGKFTFSGSRPVGASVNTIKFTGSINY